MPAPLQAKARTTPAIHQAGQRATEPTQGLAEGLAERDNRHPGAVAPARPTVPIGCVRLRPE
jgi:hypothetical protein